RLKANVAKILKDEGYIADVRESDNEGNKTLTVVLKYGRDRASAIDGVRRVSRPGRRVYVRHDRIPSPFSGLGISILSTSRGVMSAGDARRLTLGDEILSGVW